MWRVLRGLLRGMRGMLRGLRGLLRGMLRGLLRGLLRVNSLRRWWKRHFYAIPNPASL